MENKTFEIKIRRWEDWPDSLLEDYFQGEWHYFPVTELILELAGNSFISLEESEDGIKLSDKLAVGRIGVYPYCFLSGRRPDWVSNNDGLEDFEVIKKVISVTKCSGEKRLFTGPGYINYGSIGLKTPEHKDLTFKELFPAKGIANAVCIGINHLKDKYF